MGHGLFPIGVLEVEGRLEIGKTTGMAPTRSNLRLGASWGQTQVHASSSLGGLDAPRDYFWVITSLKEILKS